MTRVLETLFAYGHRELRATHRTTLEITRDNHLTGRGDCIIAVGASKGARDLSSEFKRVSSNSNSRIILLLDVGGLREVISGCGSSQLRYEHPTDLVARRSSYICSRTLMVHADKAACDLPRSMVSKLKDPSRRVEITLVAED